MEHYIIKNNKKLRYGYTTGSCAAAAAKACATMLLMHEKIHTIILDTPKGWRLNLEVLNIRLEEKIAQCAIRKDSGDDPDITNQALIYVTVTLTDIGIKIDGGKGVGRVTKEGLKCQVGEAAINPHPREMIQESLEQVAEKFDYEGGFDVLIEVPDGEILAKKTFNEKLGIVGGISILGTTGIVEPMSNSALLASIELEIKVLTKQGFSKLVFCPGNYGYNFATETLELSEVAIIKISNFVGDLFSIASEQKVQKLLLVSHIGKAIKLSGGMMNTHSKFGDCRMELLAAQAVRQNLPYKAVKEILNCVTTDAAVDILVREDRLLQVMQPIADIIENNLAKLTNEQIEIGVILFNNSIGTLAKSKQADHLLGEFKHANE